MALLIGPPWVVMNGIWSEWWWGDWELVLPMDGGHAGEVPIVLVLVLLVLPMLLV